MNESFLYYVWRHRQFDFLNARTTDGRKLDINNPGIYNTDAGPDFLQAVIGIDGIIWAGNVEIHLKSSDWFRHKHQFDDKYKSVILHVVYEYDADIGIGDNETVPTLELKNLINSEMYRKYEELITKPDILSCRSRLKELNGLLLNSQLSKVLVERLLKRQSRALTMLKACQFDWNELIYRMLAISFGCKTNSFPFEFLTQSLPYKIIRRHRESALQLDALMFGTAGFLEDAEEEGYVEKMRYEYEYLRYKYGITPISRSHWNLLRLRPQNFPKIRIAQFSGMLHRSPENLSDIVLNGDFSTVREWLSVEPHEYWRTHYRFGKATRPHKAKPGGQTIHSIFINTIIPIRFTYAKFTGDEVLQEKAIRMLDNLHFEDNKLTRVFEGTEFGRRSAADSQAMMELLKEYCIQKKCLRCAIGEKIIRKRS